MKHIFGIKDEVSLDGSELSLEETEVVSGGAVPPLSTGIRPVTVVFVEEGGKPLYPQPPVRPPIATTLALGEEGGSGGITTYAIGEEGGFPPAR